MGTPLVVCSVSPPGCRSRTVPFAPPRLAPPVGGHERTVATALHDAHDRSIVTDLVGTLLGVAVIVLLLVATLAGIGLVVVRWATALGA